jgi:hypothetical protein
MDLAKSVSDALDWAVAVDPARIKATVQRLRQKYPEATAARLAEKMCTRGQLKSLASGVATGVASNPFVAAGAALADAALTLRSHVEMAGRIAVCFDPTHFDRPGAAEELLVPILGASASNEILAAVGGVGAAGITRQLIRKSMSGPGTGILRSVLVRVLLRTVPQRSVLAKTIPLIGGLLSGWWNYTEAARVGERVRRYFAGEPLPAEPD